MGGNGETGVRSSCVSSLVGCCLEKFSSAVLWGGWIPSTQDLLSDKLSPTPTSVQVTQIPCTRQALFLDFLDNLLLLNMCVPLSWDAVRSTFSRLHSFNFSFSEIKRSGVDKGKCSTSSQAKSGL